MATFEVLYEIILVIAFAVTIYKWWRIGSPVLPGFGFFIALICLVELMLENLYYQKYSTNYPIMNLYTNVCMAYYYFCFYWVFRQKAWAKWLMGFYTVFLLAATIRSIFFITLLQLDTISYIIGLLLLFPLILRYLYEAVYIRSHYNVWNDPWIYLGFGILFFLSCAFPMLLFADSLVTYNPNNKAYITLLNIGNIVLSLAYLGISLCSRNPKTSTP